MGIILKEIDTRAPDKLDKQTIKEETKKILAEMNDLQNLLYAESKHSVLVILQGMDASGKDGVVRNVFSDMNPQGVQVSSFKTPTAEELSHDFLWRIHLRAPARGMIQIFNRSQYEDVLITRVHGWINDELAAKRFKAINQFEKLLVNHNNTKILKCYLHISPEEQSERLKERMEDATKMWKYNAKDEKEAEHWDRYNVMYEDVFKNCNDPEWLIVPADQNWYKEYVIAKALVELLKGLNMSYPAIKS
ncbi:MAG: PPK2 family polyphosphate kinase [Chitinophagaceae bacterium]